GVLLADVIRAEQRPSSWQCRFGTMTEPGPGPEAVMGADRVPSVLAGGHDDSPVVEQGELALEIQTAHVPLDRSRFVLRRRALHRRGDETTVQAEAVKIGRAAWR